MPGISRVGILGNTTHLRTDSDFKEYEAAARALKIQLQSLEVRGPNPDLEGAFQDAAKGGAERAHHDCGFRALALHKADCRPCDKEPTAFNVRDEVST